MNEIPIHKITLHFKNLQIIIKNLKRYKASHNKRLLTAKGSGNIFFRHKIIVKTCPFSFERELL